MLKTCSRFKYRYVVTSSSFNLDSCAGLFIKHVCVWIHRLPKEIRYRVKSKLAVLPRRPGLANDHTKGSKLNVQPGEDVAEEALLCIAVPSIILAVPAATAHILNYYILAKSLKRIFIILHFWLEAGGKQFYGTGDIGIPANTVAQTHADKTRLQSNACITKRVGLR